MKLLILYLGLVIIGYLIGNRLLPKNKNYKWVTTVQMVAVAVLIFTMGARIGADEKIIDGIGSIGLTSFALTIFSIAGSVLMVFLLRKLLKTDKRGMKTDG
ncbi:MAG: LysO family transporter [Peptostreptococcaceae bacterium]|nr:LysO family transporter [Peptostreptococcaceae bacterium]